jgi:hypothetical protein
VRTRPDREKGYSNCNKEFVTRELAVCGRAITINT